MELGEWVTAWTALAKQPPSGVGDATAKIDAVLELCQVPVRRDWTRPDIKDHLWTAGPYRRGDRGRPSGPERTIEHQIIGANAQVAERRSCLGGRVIDAINAIPLTRRPKVEADLLLLVDHGPEVRQYLAEVKAAANNPWYAAVELLRQFRLFAASHTADYFHRKHTQLPAGLPATGLVLASRAYYKNADQLEQTWRLVDSIYGHADLDIRVAVWDDETSQIAALTRTPAEGPELEADFD